ncbi:MAG: phosphatase PAP2 family protein [Acidobacteriota bacterium]|nr:phosphatase PAP2 family protein [Acidobacteriota bacterium]
MRFRAKHLEFGVGVVAGLALAIIALALFSWLALEVREGETLRFDSDVRSALHQHASPALTAVMKAFTVIGSSIPMLLLIVTAVLAFWLAGLRRQAMMMVIVMVGALVIELSLKHVFHRARPEPYFNVPLPSSYSFPSGHALSAACFYGMLALLLGARVRRWIYRLGIWILCGLMIVMIGVSRIYLGVHYPSDVAAGYTTACIWLVALDLAQERFKSSSAAEASRAKRLS